MLGDRVPFRPTAFDREAFERYVPEDHHLRRALEVIDWDAFDELLAPFYSADRGQPSEPPVMLLKLEYLRYHYNLSDRQVIERGKSDLAFRMFLQVDCYDTLVHPTTLCYFRGRLGAAGFQRVFDQVVAQARTQGLVKERLRIKDATHVLADIDAPSSLSLVAQIRDRLLDAAEPFDARLVGGERVNVELLRERTASQKIELRLEARVTHLKEILAWVDLLAPPADAEHHAAWQHLQSQRRLAHKILADEQDPDAGDKLRSLTDPDARRSKHGVWYDGYQLDILMDADSELITQISVLPANGDEAADAVALLRREEAAHGNDVQALSLDGAGFNGPVLRELQDPNGLAVETFVPPKHEAETGLFKPDDFAANADGTAVTCPAGQTSRYRQRDQRDHGWVHRFRREQCADCPLQSQCLQHPPHGTFGKTVRKNDYQAEYRQAREKAATAEYAEVRREHPKVERKLGEVTNRHGGRRARYRGRGKVLIQELMATSATNIKRIVHLLCAPKVQLESAS